MPNLEHSCPTTIGGSGCGDDQGLQIDGLTYRFGAQLALDGVDLAGQLAAIVNGQRDAKAAASERSEEIGRLLPED